MAKEPKPKKMLHARVSDTNREMVHVDCVTQDSANWVESELNKYGDTLRIQWGRMIEISVVVRSEIWEVEQIVNYINDENNIDELPESFSD